VTHWPKEDYGKFYDGDSYIVLRTYKKDPSGEVSADAYGGKPFIWRPFPLTAADVLTNQSY